MTEKYTSDHFHEPPPVETLEDKFAALEAKFAALEHKHEDLHQRTYRLTENETGKVTEIAVAQLTASNGIADDDVLSEEGTGPKSRARIVVNRVDPQTGERRDQLPSDSLIAPKVTDSTYAFTLRRKVYSDGDAEGNQGEIDFISPDLWNLLKRLLGHYPYNIFQGPPITLSSPYEPLILYWDKLEEATKRQPIDDNDRQARSDLKLLLDAIAAGSGDVKLDKYFKSRASMKKQDAVTFDTLWTLFPPGTLLYGKPFQGQDQVFVVYDNERVWPYLRRGSPREQDPWSLLCWTYDWDGTAFRRMPLKIDFEHFEQHKPITSLPYFPFRLHKNYKEIKKNLIERGEKYRQLCTATQGSRMFDFKGEVHFVQRGFQGLQGDDDKASLLSFLLEVDACNAKLIDDCQDDDSMSRSTLSPEIEFSPRGRGSISDPSGPSAKPTNVESRVMVDFESYFRYGPAVAQVGPLMPVDEVAECYCQDCRDNKALQENYRTRFDLEKSQSGTWEEEQYVLCPPRVLGYILRDKQWAQLQVSLLRTIPKKDPNDSWSTRLQLADGGKTKNMILNLVLGHGTSTQDQANPLEVDDIVAKKGKGLVMLLYGPPGVGKTSTAEMVAIAARKPLFSISVADVGTKAKNVEANLAKIFALATSWQAILLIDEADVFLEARGKGVASNTERNALVSVFLRVLEYYQGILMLTTNQIAQFHVAVQSRIHVAFKYHSLDQRQTMAIFMGFLQPLDDKHLVKDIDGIQEWLDEDVVKMGLDGRQIRNIVTSALGLARAQGKKKLEKSDIKMLLNNVKDFKDEFIKQFEAYKTEQHMGK